MRVACFVLDFAEYGELLSIIRKFGSLSESVLKFYMCQIIDAVRFIHLKGDPSRFETREYFSWT